MTVNKVFVDVGMRDLPFPMRVASRVNPKGQPTAGTISVAARILREFEARWINAFIKIVHEHRERIGTQYLRDNLYAYLSEFNANKVTIEYSYPYFVEKTTPVSREKCLVKYDCTYTGHLRASDPDPRILFTMRIPALTSDPASSFLHPGGLFGQLSTLQVTVQPLAEVLPEDLVDLVDRCAIAPVYSYLSDDDRHKIVEDVHAEEKTSVMLIEEIRRELAKDQRIEWFSVECVNFSMLHSYSTVLTTEKSIWISDDVPDAESV
ncbi:GTP cyclohydrolase I FolE2 [bacterium]|nr:GTP cyclohydrolase I FolE2 [bacterium]